MNKLNLYIKLIFLMLLSSLIMANPITYKLNNGLTVVLLPDPTASIVTLKTVIGVGSIYEKEYLGTGISHYLEHLVAGGSTTKHTEDEYKAILSRLGGVSNAYTTTDHTAYFINTVPEKTKIALTTLYEWMFFNELKTHEVNREKEVITREIEKNDVSIPRRFFYLSQENTYQYHPSRIPVIGYLEQFQQIQKSDLEVFYKRNYVPSNMMLFVGGDININSIKTLIEDTFGSIPKKTKPIFNATTEPLPFTAKQIKHTLPMNSTLVSMRFLTTDLYSNDLYSLDLLDYILGNGQQSLLQKKLVEELNIAFSVYTSSYTPAYTKGYFEIQIDTEEKNVNAVIQETLAIIQETKTKKLPKKLIERAKKQKLAENILNVNSIEDKIAKLSMSMLYSQTTHFFETYTSQFKSIDSTDLKIAAEKYFDTSKLITTIGLPESTKNEVNEIEKKDTPTTEKITTSTGIRVLLHSRPNEKLTKIQILTKAGLLAETKDNNGIGYLTAKLLGQSTSKYDKQYIETAFEDKGAYIEGNIGNNTLYYTLECLSEDTPELASLFFETFVDATFPKSLLKEEKRKLSNIISQRSDDWYSYNNHIFKQKLWKDHPYGLSRIGEHSSIKAITKESISSYFKTISNPKKMIISVYGNFNRSDILELINKSEAKLNYSEKPSKQLSPLQLNQSHEESLTHKFSTTSLFIGFSGAAITSTTEKLKLDLVDAVLSGMSYPGGRLHNKLRDKGYVYLVHGINFSGIDTGSFYIYALTNQTSIENAKKIIFDEIESIKDTPVSDTEFNEAIERMTYYFKDQRSSIDSQLLTAATNELYTNNMNYSELLESTIKTLTKDDILTTAKRYLVYPQTLIFQPE